MGRWLHPRLVLYGAVYYFVLLACFNEAATSLRPKVQDLSDSTQKSMAAVYAPYLANDDFKGPIMTLRRSHDNYIESFFADNSQEEAFLRTEDSTSLIDWLSNGSKSYVVMWYDQSGAGRHALQTVPSQQPYYNLSCACINFSEGTFLEVQTSNSNRQEPALLGGDGSFSVVLQHGSIGSRKAGVFGSGGNSNGHATVNIKIHYHWYELNFNGLAIHFGTHEPNNVISTIYEQEGQVQCFLNSMDSGLYQLGNKRGSNTPPATIGRSTDWSYMNGELHYLFIVHAAIPENDRNILERGLFPSLRDVAVGLDTSVAIEQQFKKQKSAIEVMQEASTSYRGSFAMQGLLTNTDKITHHAYHRYYPRYLEQYRSISAEYAMVEIGTFNYQSIDMWLSYFSSAYVYGIDLSNEFSGARHTIFQADQSKIESIYSAAHRIAHPVFFIIDDGSHIPDHQLSSFDYLFNEVLIPGGIYIVEDIETSYWTRNSLYGYPTHFGYHHARSAVEHFKMLVDDVNYEFLTDDNRNEQEKLVGRFVSSDTRKKISTITFGQNCVIILKKTTEETLFDDRLYRLRHNL